METLLSIQDKVFYVNYRGAIRQAKFDSAECWPNHICGSTADIVLKWKVAGIDEPKEWCLLDWKIYYSVEDAEDMKNEIQIETLAWQTVNKYSDNFFVKKDGYPYAYIWDGAKPVEKCLVYSLNNAHSVFVDNKFVLVSESRGKGFDAIYKTAEECKSHYRPKIVTF